MCVSGTAAITEASNNHVGREIGSMITSQDCLEAEFAKMIAAIKEVLSNEHLNITTLLEQLRSSSAVKGREVPLFDSEIFTSIHSVEDLWKLLSNYWSAYDYDILRFLINIIESKSANNIYDNFLSRIDPSALNNMEFIPECKEIRWQGLGKRLRAKIKAEKCTYDVQKTAKEQICKHFDLQIYSIAFVGIKEGCIELIFGFLSTSTTQYLQTCKVTGSTLADFSTLGIKHLKTTDMHLEVPSNITNMVSNICKLLRLQQNIKI